QLRVVVAELLQPLLERRQALDLEAEVIGPRAHDARALVVADAPGDEHERHAPVGEMEVAVRAHHRLEAELGIEIHEAIGLQRAQRNMADAPRRGRLGLDVHRGAVRHVALREIEDVAGRIVRADAGEGTRARALHHLDAALAQLREDRLELVHLETEMVEAGRAAGLARIDVEPDVAVAERHRALGPRIGRGAHAEGRLVELALQRVLVADQRNVPELRGHGALPKMARNSRSYSLNRAASLAST